MCVVIKGILFEKKFFSVFFLEKSGVPIDPYFGVNRCEYVLAAESPIKAFYEVNGHIDLVFKKQLVVLIYSFWLWHIKQGHEEKKLKVDGNGYCFLFFFFFFLIDVN